MNENYSPERVDANPSRLDAPTHATQPDHRKLFDAPRLRREERLTKMTAEQQFFGGES